MEKIDLSTNSRKIQDLYNKVIRGDGSASYAVFSVDKNGVLDASAAGTGDLSAFVDEFSDGQVQFGLARVTVPGSDVYKNLLLGWCPDNAPVKLRMLFASNFADVLRVLTGYHVQITARDQDDLDVKEFVARVVAAAGANYSAQMKSAGTGLAPRAAPAASVKPIVSKPSVAKPPVAKPSVSATPKPSVPTSTGKPLMPVKPQSAVAEDDGWGDEKELEERDFERQPLESVPSAYKPTKVDIESLRKQKSDTISSTPKPVLTLKSQALDDSVEAPGQELSLKDRMKQYQANDGRLTLMPKPKVNHAVSSRYTPAATAPGFGAKPSFGALVDKKDKLVGGISRNFGAENGKTPAQLWAEKRGKYTNVATEEVQEKTASLTVASPEDDAEVPQDEPQTESDQEQEEPQKKADTAHSNTAVQNLSFGAPPRRNLPPAPVKQPSASISPNLPSREESPALPSREESPALPSREESPALPSRDEPPSLPSRDEPPSLPSRDEPPSLPSRDEPPSLPSRDEPPSLPSRDEPPSLPSRDETFTTKPSEEKQAAQIGVTAVAQYDYEKDEDNEIGFEEGDLIVDIEFVDEEWWSGTHSKTGELGLFPGSYVQLKESSDEVDTPSEAPVEVTEELTAVHKAIAEYDYEKDEDNEISFAEGDLIVEIDFVDDSWWSGKHEKTGEVGLFPANYVSLQ